MARFNTGCLVLTRGVAARVAQGDGFASFCQESLGRHVEGDWGCLDQEDRATNDRALIFGGRLFSAYESEGLPKIWIITEADRWCTTILFPDEY